MFMFHLLVQLLLPTVKSNGVSQSISTEYKIIHGLIQTVFTAENFEILAILDLSSF